ncbi:MAG: malate synthase A [Gammaproteobacteria bacterium]|nr:malate synthase A [Gammaproteobacteria bacterium]
MSSTLQTSEISRIEVKGALSPEYDRVLTPDALSFVANLVGEFSARREDLLARRVVRQAEFDRGKLPDFLPETREIRDQDWTVAAIPPALQDRRVEITGPVERKMIINALNSDAKTFMADFEDSSSPTWQAMMDGQVNLIDAVDGSIEFVNEQGKQYRLNDDPAVLLVRPRGWHLSEKNLLMNGAPIPAGLVDFGFFLFHNARKLTDKGAGPYFYLPKIESHLEARLWNDVFNSAQDALGLPRGTIRATVLIETIPAAFEMHEILWELRDHSSGLNCGRWDYIFSFIKCFRNLPDFILPDRSEVGMTVHFLKSYSQLLIKTCHRRGIHAMGGMAAQIPIKNDPQANEEALEKVRVDKRREAENGHDGTWVAHPGLIPIAMEVFDRYMPGPNQIEKKREDVQVTQTDLLKVPEGSITMRGLKTNVAAAVRYTEEWLSGLGCVPLNNLMEDAATAEISRTQIWQWVHHPRVELEDGTNIDEEMFRKILAEELAEIRAEVGDERYENRRYRQAAEVLDRVVTSSELPAFLTLEAYGLL